MHPKQWQCVLKQLAFTKCCCLKKTQTGHQLTTETFTQKNELENFDDNTFLIILSTNYWYHTYTSKIKGLINQSFFCGQRGPTRFGLIYISTSEMSLDCMFKHSLFQCNNDCSFSSSRNDAPMDQVLMLHIMPADCHSIQVKFLVCLKWQFVTVRENF